MPSAARVLNGEHQRGCDFEAGDVRFEDLLATYAKRFTKREYSGNNWRSRLSADNETVIEVVRMRGGSVDKCALQCRRLEALPIDGRFFLCPFLARELSCDERAFFSAASDSNSQRIEDRRLCRLKCSRG